MHTTEFYAKLCSVSFLICRHNPSVTADQKILISLTTKRILLSNRCCHTIDIDTVIDSVYDVSTLAKVSNTPVKSHYHTILW